MKRLRMTSLAVTCLLASATFAWPQAVTTGGITGRALDDTGLALPGATVAITSPAMIGGGRSAVTDDQGTYRFTLLVPGIYRVSFALDGFTMLNIAEVSVSAGSTMTINGNMKVGGVAEVVNVESGAPTIDFEAATVSVNWDRDKLENLPFGKSLPALVNMIPGLSATQFDVGASTMGGTAAPPARTYGRSGGNVTTYDGVVWDQTFGDFGSYDEIQITSAAKGAEAMNPGATFNFVIKSGGNQLRGSVMTAWQDDKFQSNNINQGLLDRGLAPTSNKYTRYTDFKGDAGGPIVRDKLWFFGSYTDSYAGQYISGFVSEQTGLPAVFYTRLYGPTAKITYQATSKMKFDFVEQASRKYQPYRGADQFKPLEATESQDFWVSMTSAKWSFFPNNRVTTDFAINRAGYWWATTGWTDAVRIQDLTTGQIRGTHIQQDRDPSRWQWNGSLSWLPEIAGKNHEIKTGFLGYIDVSRQENAGYPNQQVYRYRSLAGDAGYFARPDSVQVFDYPTYTSSGVRHQSAYVNDKVNLSSRLTVNVGVRMDYYSSWLPEQGNPGTGPFATQNLFPEQRDFPVYRNWSPRTSVAYDLFGNGRVALKASYGKYIGVGSGLQAAPGPTASNVNPAAVVTRTYNNWDGSIPYVPIEANLASTSGGGGSQKLDSGLTAAIMDEFTVGTEFGTRAYLFRVNVVHKRDTNGTKTLDLAMPFDAYSDTRSAVDPGRDNFVGTADDGVMYAYSVPRTHPGFGQVNTLVTNVNDGEGLATYTAYEATFSKQHSRGWSMLANFAADVADVNRQDALNPNQALYTYSLRDWNYSVKLNGTYQLPFGISYATTYSAQSGELYGRSAQMRNALNSLVTVLVEPRVGRYEWVKLWDNRFTKTIALANRQSFEASLDFYNTLNSAAVLSQVNVNGPDYLKPSSGSSSAATATATLPPRIFRLGARWRF